MPTEVDESNKDELSIIQRGSKQRSIFFACMGLLFQILLMWSFWTFLDITGSWAFFWLGIINSEFFPFISILFLFGGGCFLLALREGGWVESWIIKKDLIPESPGILKKYQLFMLSRSIIIPRNQIQTLRIHSIPLDRIKVFNSYRIEIDYRLSFETPLETLVIFSDDSEFAGAITQRLAQKIREILELSTEIDHTESSPSYRKS
ncbi:MAG: hypothetical protein ACXADY_10735 [Candidatus Hodarchaeales archaeon]|jgi:hypothetical protein